MGSDGGGGGRKESKGTLKIAHFSLSLSASSLCPVAQEHIMDYPLIRFQQFS